MTIHDNVAEPELNNGHPYEPGPEPAEWKNAKAAAFDLGVSHMTVWRWARREKACWPFGAARQVDFSKLKHLRPPRGPA